MPSFASYDGTEIGYRLIGDGLPLVCWPGGPGRAAEYLGDLGGLDHLRQLIQVDPRGVGQSADPADPMTFRVDRLVSDLESLRVHLGRSSRAGEDLRWRPVDRGVPRFKADLLRPMGRDGPGARDRRRG